MALSLQSSFDNARISAATHTPLWRSLLGSPWQEKTTAKIEATLVLAVTNHLSFQTFPSIDEVWTFFRLHKVECTFPFLDTHTPLSLTWLANREVGFDMSTSSEIDTFSAQHFDRPNCAVSGDHLHLFVLKLFHTEWTKIQLFHKFPRDFAHSLVIHTVIPRKFTPLAPTGSSLEFRRF